MRANNPHIFRNLRKKRLVACRKLPVLYRENNRIPAELAQILRMFQHTLHAGTARRRKIIRNYKQIFHIMLYTKHPALHIKRAKQSEYKFLS